ncbi:hypothetical protein F2Q69_00021869 [Brassica cretica]|uniref:Uncharacterized protein n=1 Tax=Brassica cretica TaxID=69181 RepID=A0A8S9QKW4_BRACR|nr:hypothetical protein F2Q69_00021869 [Brassica cretica]
MHLWKRAASPFLGPDGAERGLTTIISLLHSGDFDWGTFTPKRVCPTVVLHRSQFQPDLPIEEEEDESSMGGFVPCKAPVERERSRNRKDKHIVIDDENAGGGCFPETLAEGGSVKGSEFTKASRLVNGGLLVMNRDLDVSIQEARMAQFRAEKADKNIARLRDELERSRRDEGGLVATEIRRAHRRGRR